MGYRSCVAIECDRETYEKILALCVPNFVMPDKWGRVTYKYGDPNRAPWILMWEDVKWIGYQDAFDELIAVDKVLKEGDCYHFLGVGEDGYVEEESTKKFEENFDEFVWVEHSIGIFEYLKH